ncbi:hypothetical protein JOD20_004375 [Herpetosiphon giganteus]|nr:hypothetical protein [Herpetosiphon giganteus]
MIQIVTWLTAIIAVVVGLFFMDLDLGRYPVHTWLGVIVRHLASDAGTASLVPLMLYLPCAIHRTHQRISGDCAEPTRQHGVVVRDWYALAPRLVVHLPDWYICWVSRGNSI